MESLTRHAAAIATVREFAERSGAERVVLLVDPGDGGEAAMIEAYGGTISVTAEGSSYEVPPTAMVPAMPRPLPDVRSAPPTAISFDPESGELEAPLGVVAAFGRAVLGLAQAFGGRSVATADFATREPELPLTIAAREGDPLVVAAGDRRFVLPHEALGG